MDILFVVFVGFILDLIFGDPHWFLHPVRLMGFIISNLETVIRKILPKNNKSEFIGGAILTLLMLSMSYGLPLLLLKFAANINIYFKISVECLFCYQILATKCLRVESMRVYKYLSLKDNANSRKYLSRIVGRDTENLTEKQIIKATVETVAENTCDGVIAPLLFILVGGAPLGFLYKAINTLDSMISYKNDRYMFFGKFAAKLDDVANFIPAIISSYAMILSSVFLKFDYRNAYYIYKRDKYNHASPNSGKTESVCAGALNIMLAGDAYYFGKLVKKKTIGDDNRQVEISDIKKANNLMYVTAIVTLIIFGIIRFLGVSIF